MAEKRYALTVTLRSDLHTGTGTEAAGVDSVQLLDRAGRPMVAASHLRGLLRDAAEMLAALPKSGFSHATVEALFGTGGTTRGALVCTPLRMASDTRLKRRTTTRREVDSRRPDDDTLRTEEWLSTRNVLSGWVSIHPTTKEAEALFERAVQATDRLGAHRTRGGGWVQIKLEAVAPAAPPTAADAAPSPSGDRPTLRVAIRALDALCLPTTGSPGNLVSGRTFLRGQQLRGALAQALLDRHAAADLLFAEAGPSFGDARALPLSETPPDGADAARAWLAGLEIIPIPLHVQSPKPAGQRDAQPWWSFPAPALGRPLEAASDRSAFEKRTGEKLKRPGPSELLFRRSSATGWVRYQPELRVHLRNHVVRGAPPRLFALEEVVEDTLFVADIEFGDLASAARFGTLAAPFLQSGAWLRLGRGGRPAVVVAHAWLDGEQKSARAMPEGWGEAPAPDSFTLVLESDLILRTEALGFEERLTAAALARELGLDSSAAVEASSISEPERLHGFNAISGFPATPRIAIRRGSVLRVTKGGAALRAALCEHLARGAWLGEETSLGFGRFRLLDPLGAIGAADAAGAGHGDSTANAPPVNVDELALEWAEAWWKKFLVVREVPKRRWHALWALPIETQLDVTRLLASLAEGDATESDRRAPFEELAAYLKKRRAPRRAVELIIRHMLNVSGNQEGTKA